MPILPVLQPNHCTCTRSNSRQMCLCILSNAKIFASSGKKNIHSGCWVGSHEIESRIKKDFEKKKKQKWYFCAIKQHCGLVINQKVPCVRMKKIWIHLEATTLFSAPTFSRRIHFGWFGFVISTGKLIKLHFWKLVPST